MNQGMWHCAAMLAPAIVLAMSATLAAREESYRLLSPNQATEVTLQFGDRILVSLRYKGQVLISPSPIALRLAANVVLGERPEVQQARRRAVREEIRPVVPEKRSLIPDVFNELEVRCRGNYGLRVRAYDDGVAYRFFADLPGELVVIDEEVCFNLSNGDSLYFPEEESFLSHSERRYLHLAANEISDQRMCSLPALVVKPDGLKLALAEADLWDYPGLHLRGAGAGQASLQGLFPPYPLEEAREGDRTVKVVQAADFIARTTGRRDFPWRVVAIAPEDGDLISNDIIYRLGRPLALTETSWIKPGKVAWDWWNANNLFGVDFKAGINTATYKYYLDFAAQYGLEYVILDEGWSDPADLFKVNPNLDIDALFAHARAKNVGIILWVVWCTLERQLEAALDRFAAWGAKGIKVDFMQRDDQKMVNFYERIAREAAQRRLLVDFHGSFKPTGMSRTYPHVLTREGVRGLEWNKWSKDVTPKHDLTLPFIRMFAGPMDFTPGAMRNATQESFREIFHQPMSQGTRCHQLAMYVVYESPLQMLADSPSHYLREPECMAFLAAVPTVWDETRVLAARVSEYVAVARRRGQEWYLGAMTDWTPRDLVIDFGFLPAGRYRVEIWADGVNADRYASDFQQATRELTSADRLNVHLAPGGGWAARAVRLE